MMLRSLVYSSLRSPTSRKPGEDRRLYLTQISGTTRCVFQIIFTIQAKLTVLVSLGDTIPPSNFVLNIDILAFDLSD